MTQDAIADFATWTEPDTAFQVQYSLQVFHEIDFEVVEGYRRIPHGGIEVGGLLFGRRTGSGARIEAFRQIACEHALGPSFKLSERDVAVLREQITRVDHDPELGGLETLGWFIAHTRGPLELTEAEAGLFDDLLPGAGMFTLLVKPERFKPTLFTFLVRAENGAVSRGGTDRAFILPLPGKTAGGIQQPIFAPVVPPEPEPAAELSAVESMIAEESVPEPVAKKVPEPPVQPRVEPRPIFVPSSVPPSVPPPLQPTEPPPPVAQPLWREPEMLSTPAVRPTTPEWDVAPPPPPAAPEPHPGFAGFDAPAFTRQAAPERSRSGTVVLFVILALLLGAGAGYWTYLQMSPPPIPLSIEPEASGIIVSWPPDQTSGITHASIQVNDGRATELPAEAKTIGRWQIPLEGDNVKVKLVAEHAFGKSIGLIRYVQPVAEK